MYSISQFDFSDNHYRQTTEIFKKVYPDDEPSVEAAKYYDQRRKKTGEFFERYFVLRDGEPIGCSAIADTFWNATPNQYAMNLYVLPQHQRQGAGSHLYRYLCDRLVQRGAESVLGSTLEDKPESIQFLQNRGFRQTQRNARSKLRIDDFDFDRFDDPDSRLAEQGLTIYTLNELKERDDDWFTKILDLSNESGRDMPRSEPYIAIAAEQFRSWLDEPNSNHDCWFYAVEQGSGRYVGVSTIVCQKSNPKRYYVGYTGVDKAYRRRGVATALKLKTIRFANQNGGETIETDNADDNPMYQLNLILGFEPMPAELSFKKELEVK